MDLMAAIVGGTVGHFQIQIQIQIHTGVVETLQQETDYQLYHLTHCSTSHLYARVLYIQYGRMLLFWK